MDTKELKEIFRKKASEDYENFFAGETYVKNVGSISGALEKKKSVEILPVRENIVL